jgi:hypothetical protein
VRLESDYDLEMRIKTIIVPGESSQQSLNFGRQEMTGMKSITVYPMIGSTEKMVCENAGISLDLPKC